MNCHTERLQRTIKLTTVIALTLAATPLNTNAHGLRHSISSADAVVVTITHEDGTPFSDEHYQVYRGDDTLAFQTGRTDELGRVVFLPDQGGTWRVRAFSEDGHGVDVELEPDAYSGEVTADNTGSHLTPRVRLAVALALLFGVFGVVKLFYRRRP